MSELGQPPMSSPDGPPPPPPISSSGAVPGPSGGFAGIAPRPAGQRYGDGDLVPGGDVRGGGMLMGPPIITTPPTAEGFARYDVIFPGSNLPRQPHFLQPPGAAPSPFPGEPDPDHLLPLQGGPHDPFGGPGHGQFGPRGPPRQPQWGAPPRGGRGGGFGGGFV